MKLASRHVRVSQSLVCLAAAWLSLACSSDPQTSEDTSRSEVLSNYAEMVSANYNDTLSGAKKLDKAIQDFTKAPSAEGLENAKKAWLASRNPYLQSEVYRFYQGPIDNDDPDDDVEEGPEPWINSWPLDESYIDYTLGSDGKRAPTGIINLPEEFPDLTAKVLAEANAKVSETTISTGYHAIEFLLWGQDFNVEGPGDRPYTDFVEGDESTADNAARRSEYLSVISTLMVSQLERVNDAWLPDANNYRADFLAMPESQALGKLLLGLGALAGGELSNERMRVAYDNKDQEDEHSCFSDNTLNDLHYDALGVQNVLEGRYGKLEGASVVSLVEAKDSKLADKLREQIQTALDEIDAIDVPFDAAVEDKDDSPYRDSIPAARAHILATIEALQSFRDTLVDAAKLLNVKLELDE